MQPFDRVIVRPLTDLLTRITSLMIEFIDEEYKENISPMKFIEINCL